MQVLVPICFTCNGTRVDSKLPGKSSKPTTTVKHDDLGTTMPRVRKTLAESSFEKASIERRRGELRKAGPKSHREKVSEFNEKLSKLSEHYDIPKVRPKLFHIKWPLYRWVLVSESAG